MNSELSTWLCTENDGVKGVHHHVRLQINFLFKASLLLCDDFRYLPTTLKGFAQSMWDATEDIETRAGEIGQEKGACVVQTQGSEFNSPAPR